MKEVLKSETVLSSSNSKSQASSTNADGEQMQTVESMAGVFNRTIPQSVVAHYVSLLAGMEAEIIEAIGNDDVTKAALVVEREAERAENMLLHDQEITARPPRTWYQTETQKSAIRDLAKAQSELEIDSAKVGFVEATFAQKAKLMAAQDDYRMAEDDRQKKKEHSMPRRKKRRLEAMRAADAGSEGPSRGSVKEMKEEIRDKVLSKSNVAAGGLSTNMRESHKTGSKKVHRPVFAVGGLDQDMAEWSGKGETSKDRKKAGKKDEKEFTEFDPNKKLKKGGKTGTNAFKSKAKHKRR
jgi:ATP-dependent RNA helicase DDX27